MSEAFNLRTALARLEVRHMEVYLQAKGWELTASPHEHQLRFLGEDFGGGRYELLVPKSKNFGRLQRMIFKLSCIEDREPSEVVGDIFTEFDRAPAPAPAPSTAPAAGRERMRFRNSSSAPITIRVLSRAKEHELHPGEAVELNFPPVDGEPPVVEVTEGGIVIRDA